MRQGHRGPGAVEAQRHPVIEIRARDRSVADAPRAAEGERRRREQRDERRVQIGLHLGRHAGGVVLVVMPVLPAGREPTNVR